MSEREATVVVMSAMEHRFLAHVEALAYAGDCPRLLQAQLVLLNLVISPAAHQMAELQMLSICNSLQAIQEAVVREEITPEALDAALEAVLPQEACDE